MARAIGIGNQDFEKIRVNNNFYIDKTVFIRKWWESGDEVTLITRPRRFGKTLNMSMIEKFFSTDYKNRKELFVGLNIWEYEKYRELQGTYPVLFLSFADVKEISYEQSRKKICSIIKALYNKYTFLLDGNLLNENEKMEFRNISANMEDYQASGSLKELSSFLYRYYKKRVIILLDEYDTPMQEAYLNGYWNDLVAFTRSLFNSTFKTNPCLERAIMTGITRISKESVFSDLNNLEVVTTTSKKYDDCFGFTEEEVFTSLKEYGLSDHRQQIKDWYDGFSFGERKDIYNPWSIINFLDKKEVGTYWVNSSSNNLVGKLIREGSPEIKMTMGSLLRGEVFYTSFDEQLVYDQLDQGDGAVWSLLLASGYLRAVYYEFNTVRRRAEYTLELPNMEVRVMFEQMIESWFSTCRRVNNAFLQAMLTGDVKAMNTYMNKVALQTFSYFDAGKNPSEEEPERFYHGFVLGMMVELSDRYVITSNRESGFGRYDVVMEPVNPRDNSIIIEFKVQDEDEKDLSNTVQDALRQIRDMDYQSNLLARGIPEERILKYGFAFCGKKVLIAIE